MNMKKFLTVLLLGIAAFAVSCSDDDSSSTTDPTKTITAKAGSGFEIVDTEGNATLSAVTGSAKSDTGFAMTVTGLDDDTAAEVYTVVAAIDEDDLDSLITFSNLTVTKAAATGSSPTATFEIEGTDAYGVAVVIELVVTCEKGPNAS